MQIAVIADTHDTLPPRLVAAIRAADEIWHLGDVCDPALLAALHEELGKSLYVVRGNQDWCERWPRRLLLERCGRRFLLVHVLPSRPGGADFLLCGHTHIPCDEIVGSTRVLNPGSVGKPNRGAPASWAWLVIDEERSAVQWKLVVL